MSNCRNAAFAAALLTAVSVAAVASEIKLTGTPPDTAVVGEPYRFVFKVANADVPNLEFAYINRPSWSGYYRSSGAIIGVPTEPGVYPDIQIEAGDGVHFGISAPFTITVLPAAAPSAASVTLSWVKPWENTDGSALTNLAGYVIRYGTSATQLDTQLIVNSADSTTAEIGGLAPGDWYFEIASVTDGGVRGPFSAIVHDSI